MSRGNSEFKVASGSCPDGPETTSQQNQPGLSRRRVDQFIEVLCMKCTDFERNVLSLASDQLADASLRDLSLAHVRLCNHCANRLTEEQNLIAGIRAVQAELAAE